MSVVKVFLSVNCHSRFELNIVLIKWIEKITNEFFELKIFNIKIVFYLIVINILSE